MAKAKHILITPLDWGLGHATRMVPIINHLLALGQKVSIASSGRAGHLLKQTFKQLPYYDLPEYNAKYKGGLGMVFDMALQTPRLLKVISDENKLLNRLIDEHQFDAVISDNRYGCYTNKVPSVFVTHQVNILMPVYAKWVEPLVKLINERFITRYNELWIPDYEGESNLSGKLSHGGLPKLPVNYIGPLSRLEKQVVDSEYDIVAILSGPEPMRTYFERILLRQLSELDLKCLIVQGKPEVSEQIEQGNIKLVSSLNTDELGKAIASAKIVIARAGYSSIMDLIKLGKKALLVPTPSQTEQEYLAKRMKKKGWFYSINQNELKLKTDLEKVINYTPPEISTKENLKEKLEQWLSRLP